MKKYRLNQKVYFYMFGDDHITCGHISAINTSEKGVEYIVSYPAPQNIYWAPRYDTCKSTCYTMYASYRKAYKKHYIDIIRAGFKDEVAELRKALNQVFTDYAAKIENDGIGKYAIKLDAHKNYSLVIDGIGDVKEKIDNIEDRLNKLEKKKKKTTSKTKAKKETK